MIVQRNRPGPFGLDRGFAIFTLDGKALMPRTSTSAIATSKQAHAQSRRQGTGTGSDLDAAQTGTGTRSKTGTGWTNGQKNRVGALADVCSCHNSDQPTLDRQAQAEAIAVSAQEHALVESIYRSSTLRGNQGFVV